MEHNYSDNNDRKSYRILVVDDEQDLCEILRFNLEAEGYQVVTANSAEEALLLDLACHGKHSHHIPYSP